jgi:membrane-bound serine protease (ClpP class)
MAPAALADPNLAFLLVVLGLLGVYWELHAPGMMLPGIIGVLLVCVGAYGLYQDHPTWYGLIFLVLAVFLLGIELKFYTHMISGTAGAILLAFGAILLIQGPNGIAPAFAIAISAAFGIIAIFLGVLANRARTSRVMTGVQQLVGETGIARTEINPEGTVFVQGAYWQARSDHLIPAGRRVSVERVDNLVLFVKEA